MKYLKLPLIRCYHITSDENGIRITYKVWYAIQHQQTNMMGTDAAKVIHAFPETPGMDDQKG